MKDTGLIRASRFGNHAVAYSSNNLVRCWSAISRQDDQAEMNQTEANNNNMYHYYKAATTTTNI